MAKQDREGQTCPGDDALEVKEAILRNAIATTRNAAEFAKEDNPAPKAKSKNKTKSNQ